MRLFGLGRKGGGGGGVPPTDGASSTKEGTLEHPEVDDKYRGERALPNPDVDGRWPIRREYTFAGDGFGASVSNAWDAVECTLTTAPELSKELYAFVGVFVAVYARVDPSLADEMDDLEVASAVPSSPLHHGVVNSSSSPLAAQPPSEEEKGEERRSSQAVIRCESIEHTRGHPNIVVFAMVRELCRIIGGVADASSSSSTNSSSSSDDVLSALVHNHILDRHDVGGRPSSPDGANDASSVAPSPPQEGISIAASSEDADSSNSAGRFDPAERRALARLRLLALLRAIAVLFRWRHNRHVLLASSAPSSATTLDVSGGAFLPQLLAMLRCLADRLAAEVKARRSASPLSLTRRQLDEMAFLQSCMIPVVRTLGAFSPAAAAWRCYSCVDVLWRGGSGDERASPGEAADGDAPFSSPSSPDTNDQPELSARAALAMMLASPPTAEPPQQLSAPGGGSGLVFSSGRYPRRRSSRGLHVPPSARGGSATAGGSRRGSFVRSCSRRRKDARSRIQSLLINQTKLAQAIRSDPEASSVSGAGHSCCGSGLTEGLERLLQGGMMEVLVLCLTSSRSMQAFLADAARATTRVFDDAAAGDEAASDSAPANVDGGMLAMLRPFMTEVGVCQCPLMLQMDTVMAVGAAIAACPARAQQQLRAAGGLDHVRGMLAMESWPRFMPPIVDASLGPRRAPFDFTERGRRTQLSVLVVCVRIVEEVLRASNDVPASGGMLENVRGYQLGQAESDAGAGTLKDCVESVSQVSRAILWAASAFASPPAAVDDERRCQQQHHHQRQGEGTARTSGSGGGTERQHHGDCFVECPNAFSAQFRDACDRPHGDGAATRGVDAQPPPCEICSGDDELRRVWCSGRQWWGGAAPPEIEVYHGTSSSSSRSGQQSYTPIYHMHRAGSQQAARDDDNDDRPEQAVDGGGSLKNSDMALSLLFDSIFSLCSVASVKHVAVQPTSTDDSDRRHRETTAGKAAMRAWLRRKSPEFGKLFSDNNANGSPRQGWRRSGESSVSSSSAAEDRSASGARQGKRRSIPSESLPPLLCRVLCIVTDLFRPTFDDRNGGGGGESGGNNDDGRSQRWPECDVTMLHHVLLFLHRCLLLNPTDTITLCRNLDIWDLLLSVVYFAGHRTIDRNLKHFAPTESGSPAERRKGCSCAAGLTETTMRMPAPGDPSSSEVNTHAVAAEHSQVCAWFCVRDGVLTLMEEVVTSLLSKPTRNLIAGPTEEISKVLDLLRLYPDKDDVVLHVTRWLQVLVQPSGEHTAAGLDTLHGGIDDNPPSSWLLLSHDKALERASRVRPVLHHHNTLSLLFTLCRRQLHVLGLDVDSAALNSLPHKPKLDATIATIEHSRPLLWPARHSVLSLIYILLDCGFGAPGLEPFSAASPLSGLSAAFHDSGAVDTAWTVASELLQQEESEQEEWSAQRANREREAVALASEIEANRCRDGGSQSPRSADAESSPPIFTEEFQNARSSNSPVSGDPYDEFGRNMSFSLATMPWCSDDSGVDGGDQSGRTSSIASSQATGAPRVHSPLMNGGSWCGNRMAGTARDMVQPMHMTDTLFCLLADVRCQHVALRLITRLLQSSALLAVGGRQMALDQIRNSRSVKRVESLLSRMANLGSGYEETKGEDAETGGLTGTSIRADKLPWADLYGPIQERISERYLAIMSQTSSLPGWCQPKALLSRLLCWLCVLLREPASVGSATSSGSLGPSTGGQLNSGREVIELHQQLLRDRDAFQQLGNLVVVQCIQAETESESVPSPLPSSPTTASANQDSKTAADGGDDDMSDQQTGQNDKEHALESTGPVWEGTPAAAEDGGEDGAGGQTENKMTRHVGVVQMILAALTALTAHNATGKTKLKELFAPRHGTVGAMSGGGHGQITFAQLKDLLLKLCCGEIRRPIYLTLMDMLFDGRFIEDAVAPGSTMGAQSQPQQVQQFCNPDVVPLLFSLLPHTSPDLQLEILDAFVVLVCDSSSSRLNQSVCCHVQPPLVDQLLDVFPRLPENMQSRAIKLIEHLGAHSITVRQLKRIFRLMQTRGPASRPFRPQYCWRLLGAVKGMIPDTDDGPRRFFFLDGITSGLALRPMPRWPAQKSYCFCTWVRLEGIDSHHAAVAKALAVQGVSVAESVLGRSGRGASFAADTPVFARARQDGRKLVVTPFLVSLHSEVGEGPGLDVFFRPKMDRPVAGAADRQRMHKTKLKTASYYELVVRVRKDNNKVVEKVLDRCGMWIKEKQWYFIAVSHSKGLSKRIGSRSELRVFVNGKSVTDHLSFPKLRSAVPHAYIGTAPPHVCKISTHLSSSFGKPEPPMPSGANSDAQTANTVDIVHPNLSGQLGSSYFFAESLSEAQLKGIYDLGPNYSFSFEPCASDVRDLGIVEQGRNLALDGSLTGKIMMAFNPTVWRGDYFIDNTPEKNLVAWGSAKDLKGVALEAGAGNDPGMWNSRHGPNQSRSQSWASCPLSYSAGHMHAQRLVGTHECVTRSVRDVMDCLGGIKILFPLFAQYDRPTVHTFVENAGLSCDIGRENALFGEALSAGNVDYSVDPRLNVKVLELLWAMLRHNQRNESFMKKSTGFAVVGYLLERVSPRHMSEEALDTIIQLIDRLSSNQLFVDSAIDHLLTNFGLWVYTPTNVQLRLMRAIQKHILKAPAQYRKGRAFSVCKCLDALRLYYWHEPPWWLTLLDEAEDPAMARSNSVWSSSDAKERPDSPAAAAGLDDETFAQAADRAADVSVDDVKRRSSLRSQGSSGRGSAAQTRSESVHDPWGNGAEEDLLWTSRQWVHPETREIVGRRRTGADLRKIRSILLDIVFSLVSDGDGILPEEVEVIVGFLGHSHAVQAQVYSLRLGSNKAKTHPRMAKTRAQKNSRYSRAQSPVFGDVKIAAPGPRRNRQVSEVLQLLLRVMEDDAQALRVCRALGGPQSVRRVARWSLVTDPAIPSTSAGVGDDSAAESMWNAANANDVRGLQKNGAGAAKAASRSDTVGGRGAGAGSPDKSGGRKAGRTARSQQTKDNNLDDVHLTSDEGRDLGGVSTFLSLLGCRDAAVRCLSLLVVARIATTCTVLRKRHSTVTVMQHGDAPSGIADVPPPSSSPSSPSMASGAINSGAMGIGASHASTQAGDNPVTNTPQSDSQPWVHPGMFVQPPPVHSSGEPIRREIDLWTWVGMPRAELRENLLALQNRLVSARKRHATPSSGSSEQQPGVLIGDNRLREVEVKIVGDALLSMMVARPGSIRTLARVVVEAAVADDDARDAALASSPQQAGGDSNNADAEMKTDDDPNLPDRYAEDEGGTEAGEDGSEDGKYRQHSTSRDLFEMMSDATIQLPEVLPALLRLLGSSNADTLLRRDHLCCIKMLLATRKNCDGILQQCGWQHSFFCLLAAIRIRLNDAFVCLESHRGLRPTAAARNVDDDDDGKPVGSPKAELRGLMSRSLHATSTEYERWQEEQERLEIDVSREEGVADFVMRIFADLHMHAIKFKAPVPSNVAAPFGAGRRWSGSVAGGGSGTNMHAMDSPKLAAKRKLVNGFKVVEETVSFLRCQAMTGALDAVTVGTQLLQQLLSMIKAEVETQISREAGETRRRSRDASRSGESPGGLFGDAVKLPTPTPSSCESLIAGNMWHIAAIVQEFLLLPPMQLAGQTTTATQRLFTEMNSPARPTAAIARAITTGDIIGVGAGSCARNLTPPQSPTKIWSPPSSDDDERRGTPLTPDTGHKSLTDLVSANSPENTSDPEDQAIMRLSFAGSSATSDHHLQHVYDQDPEDDSGSNDNWGVGLSLSRDTSPRHCHVPPLVGDDGLDSKPRANSTPSPPPFPPAAAGHIAGGETAQLGGGVVGARGRSASCDVTVGMPHMRLRVFAGGVQNECATPRGIEAAESARWWDRQLWNLVESLVDVLEVLGMTTWTGRDAGLVPASPPPSPTLEARCGVETATPPSLANVLEGGTTTPVESSPLRRRPGRATMTAADGEGVPRMLLRLLLNTVVAGGRPHVRRSSFLGCQSTSVALAALRRVEGVLAALEISAHNEWEFEALYVVATLSNALRDTSRRPDSEWVIAVIKQLAYLLKRYRPLLREYVLKSLVSSSRGAPTSLSVEPPPEIKRVEAAVMESPPRNDAPSRWRHEGSRRGFMGEGEPRRRFSRELLGDDAPSDSPTQRRRSDAVADITMNLISDLIAAPMISSAAGSTAPGQRQQRKESDAALRYPSGRTVMTLTWEIWGHALAEVVRKGEQEEKDATSKSFTPLGEHKSASKSSQVVRQLESAEESARNRQRANGSFFVSLIQYRERQHLREVLFNYETRQAKAAARWGRILQQLTHERGPWGFGRAGGAEGGAEGGIGGDFASGDGFGSFGFDNDSRDVVYWKMDEAEDASRCRRRLVRNPYGSNHLLASMSAGGERTREAERRKQVRLKRDASKAAAAAGRRRLGIAGLEAPAPISRAEDPMNLGLWRDLVKYQKAGSGVKKRQIAKQESPAVAVEGGEGEEDGSDAEDVDDTLEAQNAKTDTSSMYYLDFEDDEDDIPDDIPELGYVDTSADDKSGEGGVRRRLLRGAGAGGRFGGKRRQGGYQQMISTWPCEVITPYVVTSGTLELRKHSLTFVRADPQPCRDEDGENGGGGGGGGGGVNNSGESEHGSQSWALALYKSRTWLLQVLSAARFRHYQMQPTAMELFFMDHTSCFINLHEKGACKKFHKLLRNLRPPNLEVHRGRHPLTVLHNTKYNGEMTLTMAWVQREISNFDYIMALNTIAGRTYNDLAQYPVCPWVISNYTSSELDLRDPDNFRDLAWPMGAQLPEQRQMFQERYRTLDAQFQEDMQRLKDEVDEDDMVMDTGLMHPFHYGTHYSNSGYVLWYLLRLEPYASLHIELQSGRFDRPDRQFNSIEAAYRSATTSGSDVKELIPEFFFLPDCLRNANDFDLGTTQKGATVGDVLLPPWAKGSTAEFIRLNREALESEYVSRNIHQWIDLVFGFKQRPPIIPRGSDAAVEACNVFFHLTYPDAVNLEKLKMEDPALYETTIKQIDNFGQTPAQLFDRPHPQRQTLADVIFPLASSVPGLNTVPRATAHSSESVRRAAQGFPRPPKKPRTLLAFPPEKVSTAPLIFICECGGNDPGVAASSKTAGVGMGFARRGGAAVAGSTADHLVTVDAERVWGYHKWCSLSPDIQPPFRLMLDPLALELSLAAGGGKSTGGILGTMGAVVSGHIGGNQPSARERRLGVPFDIKGHTTQLYRFADNLHTGSGGLSLEAGASAALGGAKSLRPKLKRGSTVPMLATPGAGSSGSGSGGLQSRKRPPQQQRHKKSWSWGDGGNDDDGFGLSPGMFACHSEGRLLFSCGHWDHSFKVTSLETGRMLQSVAQHKDVVTCLCLTTDGRHLVTGSRDSTVMIWKISIGLSAQQREEEHKVMDHSMRRDRADIYADGFTIYEVQQSTGPVFAQPVHTFYGHDDAVRCVAVDTGLDTVVSGSDDGTVIVHSLYYGNYIRTVVPGIGEPDRPMQDSSRRRSSTHRRGSPGQGVPGTGGALPQRGARRRSRVHWVGISHSLSHVLSYSPDENLLSCHSLNGVLMSCVQVEERLHCFLFSEDGNFILSGGEDGAIVIRHVHTLELAEPTSREGGIGPRLDGRCSAAYDVECFGSPIRSMVCSYRERHLLVGLGSGEMRILALDAKYLRERLQRKLRSLGF